MQKYRAEARPVVILFFIAELGLVTNNDVEFSMFLIKKKYVTMKKARPKYI